MKAKQELTLIAPTAELRDSYFSYLSEFTERKEKLVPFVLELPCDDFEQFIQVLADQSRGIGIPEGFVPNTTFWLVDQNRQIVGVSNLRHKLTPALEEEGGHIGFSVRPSFRKKGYGSAILAETLKQAGKQGIPRALVTCSKENIGSSRVIIVNDGVLESEQYIPHREEVVQRYWIEL